ncbi:HEPN domain-containing protein [candidate division KSB1 bacterium]|nr:HEPN domain-containing protein [candidate division KSB1 bacterium]
MKKATRNWIATSEYDIETAEHMLKSGRYVYVVFMCHLSVEKLLKGLVAETQEDLPPKTHNLRYLVKLSKIEIPEEHATILDVLNTTSIPTRYPEDIEKLLEKFPKEVVKNYFNQTKKLRKWLRQDKRLQE